MSHRQLLALLVLALSAAGLMLWSLAADPSGSTEGSPEAARDNEEEPSHADGARAASLRTIAGGDRSAVPDEDRAKLEAQLAAFAETQRAFTLRGRLIAKVDEGDSEIPLAAYTVRLIEVGSREWRSNPNQPSANSGDDGSFNVDGLNSAGPWDLLVTPLDLGGGLLSSAPIQLIGTASAELPEVKSRPVYAVPVGPIITLRSLLQPGLDASNVLFEARGRTSPLSSMRGSDGGFAIGRMTPEGFLQAAVPSVTHSMPLPRCGARVTSRDGLYGVAAAWKGTLKSGRHLEIEAPMSPRGGIRFQVQFESEEDALELDLVQIGWRLPFGDPERDALRLPESLVADWQGRARVAVDSATFEVGDLPIGPVEVPAGPAYEGAYFEVARATRGNAVHGEPETVVVVVRRPR